MVPLSEGGLILLLLFVLVLLVIIFVIKYSGDKKIFYPTHTFRDAPLAEHKTFMVGDIHGRIFLNFINRPIILYCHGSAGDINDTQPMIDICQSQQINLLVFDYSGYGQSRGKPSLEGILDSTINVFDWMKDYLKRHDSGNSEVIVWGVSMGGSPALSLALQREVSAVIVSSSYLSFEDVLCDYVGGMAGHFVSRIYGDLCNKDMIQHVKVPIVILHSSEDELIQFRHGQQLYQRINHNKKLFLEIKGPHAAPQITTEQLGQVLEFCGLDGSKASFSHYSLQQISQGAMKSQI